jgi:hypothetical protein
MTIAQIREKMDYLENQYFQGKYKTAEYNRKIDALKIQLLKILYKTFK